MVRIILFSVLTLISATAFGQSYSVTPATLASSGGSQVIGGVDLAWTVGEAVIFTMEGTSNILTNGLHQTDEFCFGDYNFDGEISSGDLLVLLATWQCTDGCYTDLTDDGQVSSADLLVFLSIYGTSCFGSP